MPVSEALRVSGTSVPPGAVAALLAGLIRAYQLAFSWLFAGSCRFTPSCSQYAREAVLRHGAARGGWLAVRRMCRCLPFGGYGFDPVPEASGRTPSARRL